MVYFAVESASESSSDRTACDLECTSTLSEKILRTVTVEPANQVLLFLQKLEMSLHGTE
jgi:hypothetical protein